MAKKPVVEIGPFGFKSGKEVDKDLAKIAVKSMEKAAQSSFKSKFEPVTSTKEKTGYHYEARLLVCKVDGSDVKVEIEATAHRLENMRPMIKAKTGAGASGKPERAVDDAIWGAVEANIKKVGPQLLKLKG
ncbi:MAG: hypothetical protein ACF8Q5_00525 [Phycisphaerales bacterium JB040]